MCPFSWNYAINDIKNGDKNEKQTHRCNINRLKARHGHKYSKYKKYIRMMMLRRFKEHFSNI